MFENGPDNAILIPLVPFRPLVFGEYLNRGATHKMFAGECINSVCRNEDDPYLFYIVQGTIAAEYLHEDGTTLTMYKRSAGNAFQSEFAGIASLGGAAHLQFTAVENTVLVSFTYAQTYELACQDPRAFEDLVYISHMSFGQFAHRLDNVSSSSASHRMLTWLKKLMDVNAPDADGQYRILCNMTLQDISDHLLIHITTCSRLVTALKDKGIVDRTKKYLVIRDPKALAELAIEENVNLY